MPLGGTTPPTISQIYAAFDDNMHRVFRRAMHLSRGGTVRTGDVLTALHDLGRRVVAGLLPADWRPPPLVHPDPRPLVAMSNEPAVKAWLAEALALAERVPNRDKPSLTMATAWAIAFRLQSVPLQRALPEALSALGLPWPETWTVRHVVPPAVKPVVVTVRCSRGGQIETVLNEWLALQEFTDPSQLQAGRAALAQQVRKIECTERSFANG